MGQGLPAITVALDPPYPVQALLREDDTCGVLAADPGLRDPGEPMIRVMTAIHEQRPAEPGSLTIRKGTPLHLLAHVIDLDADPICRPAWIRLCLEQALRELPGTVRDLGMECLGCVRGGLSHEVFLLQLQAVLQQAPSGLQRLWLLGDPDQPALRAFQCSQG